MSAPTDVVPARWIMASTRRAGLASFGREVEVGEDRVDLHLGVGDDREERHGRRRLDARVLQELGPQAERGLERVGARTDGARSGCRAAGDSRRPTPSSAAPGPPSADHADAHVDGAAGAAVGLDVGLVAEVSCRRRPRPRRRAGGGRAGGRTRPGSACPGRSRRCRSAAGELAPTLLTLALVSAPHGVAIRIWSPASSSWMRPVSSPMLLTGVAGGVPHGVAQPDVGGLLAGDRAAISGGFEFGMVPGRRARRC